jgi:hypothetical protein
MTTAADDSAVEEAFEAVLAGRPVPEEGTSLVAFTEAVRSSASTPGRPNAALAGLLADGLLTDQPSPSARTAPRRRRRLAMFFPALLAKILSAGAVAQAATGAGIVLVAFTGAGAAGALPDSLQHGFATVASTVGIQVDDPQQTDGDVVPTVPATATPDATDVAPATDDGEASDPPATDDGYTLEDWEQGPGSQSFGDWVSKGARHGYADGATISHWAYQKGVVLPEQTTGSTPDDETGPTPAPSPTTTSHGNGNAGDNHGNGNGNGNAGGNGSRHGNR